MRPWQHARASAHRSGRDWREDLAIHELVDLTKASLADLRHRMVLHNCDLGPALAARAFPDRPHAADVARDHAREDLGVDVPIAWWLGQCDPAKLPRPRPVDLADLVERERRRARLRDPDGPREVLDLLTLPERLAPAHGRLGRAVLANAAGLAVVRAVLGPPRVEVGHTEAEVVFDPGFCAEALIVAMFGRIPDLRTLADALRADADLTLRAMEVR